MADSPSVPPSPDWITHLRDQPDVQVPPSPEIERRDIPPSVPPADLTDKQKMHECLDGYWPDCVDVACGFPCLKTGKFDG